MDRGKSNQRQYHVTVRNSERSRRSVPYRTIISNIIYLHVCSPAGSHFKSLISTLFSLTGRTFNAWPNWSQSSFGKGKSNSQCSLPKSETSNCKKCSELCAKSGGQVVTVQATSTLYVFICLRVRHSQLHALLMQDQEKQPIPP